MTFSTIRAAQRAAWPRVQQSLDLIRSQREAVNRDPHLASAAARARARTPWNRVVANEAVWALAKEDLLNTPEQAAVLTAARKWVRSWDFPPSHEDDPEDRELYDAVQRLLTVIDIPDEIPV